MGFYGSLTSKNNYQNQIAEQDETSGSTTLAKANIGICEGYNNTEEVIDDDFEDYLQAKLEEISNQLGFFVSFIVYKTKTVYKKEWGCPEGGEKTYNLEATRNPVFEKDDLVWRDQVKQIIRILKRDLRQTTVTLQFIPIEIVYIRSEREE